MIQSFRGPYYFLSNFSREGAIKPTVEHQFQATKATTVENAIYVMAAESPGEAKKRGRQIRLRSDWEDIKLERMWDLVWTKFAEDESLAQRLLDTGEEELVEGNTWGDTYWGVCRGKGENHLGKILMDVRADLDQTNGA